jgi:CBS domain containing-hemolysin-like protein
MMLIALGLGLAVLLSALFTLAQLAIFTPSESRVRTLADEGFRGGAALAELRTRPERVLVLLRLIDAFADMTAGVLAGHLAWLEWGMAGLAYAIGGITFVILYFGELLPIGIAVNHGLKLALWIAPVLLVVVRVLSVPLGLLARLANANGRNGAAAKVSESEIRQLTALGHTEGVIEEHERELIERAFRLDRTRAWDIMTPRVDLFAWPDQLRLQDIATQLGTVRYSRVPVYGKSVDDITGVLYTRDAYQALVSGQRDVPLKSLAREPLVVPGSVPLSKLLRDFQTRRIHMAIVVDEYGGTDGLVTLEDVIEELVGEIVDETDVAEEPITRVSRNEIIAAGDADLREINHRFNTTFPQLEHRSLSGWLLEELGRVPEPGERLERDGVTIEVLDATETQVTRVRLRRTSAAEAIARSNPPDGTGPPGDGDERPPSPVHETAFDRRHTGDAA